jgi:hypothetical protein
MRLAGILMLSPLLAGCAVPGAIGLAGIAIEGASVIATGKSASDQIVSAAVDKDCELIEGLTRGKACKDRKQAKKEEQPSTVAKTTENTRPVRRHRWIPRTKVDDRWTFHVGTFRELGEATKRARLASPGKASISSTVVDGEVHYRVTVGLFPFANADSERDRVGGAGTDKMAVLRVCPSWMQDASCVSLDRVIPQKVSERRKKTAGKGAGN